MELVEVDSATVWVLMTAGAIFSSVGLWLLLRPRPTEGAAKLELLGMKVESGSVGLLVVLIGAGFLLLPLIAPVRDALPSGGPSAVGGSHPAAATGQRTALLLPEGPNAREQEPNSTLRQASQLEIGTIVSGRVSGNDSDWYVVPIVGDTIGPLELKLALGQGATSPVSVAVFDAREVRVGGLSVYSGANYIQVPDGGDRIYIKVSGFDSYELSVARNGE